MKAEDIKTIREILKACKDLSMLKECRQLIKIHITGLKKDLKDGHKT